jgi:hypothetical protein
MQELLLGISIGCLIAAFGATVLPRLTRAKPSQPTNAGSLEISLECNTAPLMADLAKVTASLERVRDLSASILPVRTDMAKPGTARHRANKNPAPRAPRRRK